MTSAGWRLWSIISIWSLGVSLEFHGWEFWFVVKGIYNFTVTVDIRFWWYLCVLVFFIFVLLSCFCCCCSWRYSTRVNMNVCSSILFDQLLPILSLYLARTSPVCLICFFEIEAIYGNLFVSTIPYMMIPKLYFLWFLVCS